jgi:ABC-type multidrug transport system permease subunit
VAFILILNYDDWSIFSRYGFYIVVSGLCWTTLLIILVLHGIGFCAGFVYEKWQREYSLFVFMLSYSLSFMFLFFFGSALLAQWAYDVADGFLIFCVVSKVIYPTEMT